MSTDESTSIDVGSWFATLARNWWVIVGLVVIGIVVGAVVTMAQPKEYTATASVYIGQTTDANGNAMAGLNSNAKAAIQLLASQVVLDAAAERAGMDISASLLRKETTVETPSSTVKTTTSVVNIVVISVTDTKKARAAAAANALAAVLLEHLDIGTSEKIAILEEQLADRQGAGGRRDSPVRGGPAGDNRHRQQRHDRWRRRRRPPRPTSPWSRRRPPSCPTSRSSNQKTALLLLTAKQVEQPRILHEAGIPDSPSGPSMTMNVAIGALAGLVIGIIVAFARRGLADRRAGKAAAA